METNNLIILIRHFPTTDELEDKVSSNVDTPSVLKSSEKESFFLSEELCKLFKRVAIRNIFTSDSLQATETAKMLANNTGLKLQSTFLLRNINRPLWEGLTNEEVKTIYPKEFNVWCNRPGEVKFKNGESIADVRHRVRLFKKKYPGPKVVVTHTTTFQSFVLENFSLSSNFAWDFKPEMYCFTVINNGTLWALNSRSLDYITLNYK